MDATGTMPSTEQATLPDAKPERQKRRTPLEIMDDALADLAAERSDATHRRDDEIGEANARYAGMIADIDARAKAYREPFERHFGHLVTTTPTEPNLPAQS